MVAKLALSLAIIIVLFGITLSAQAAGESLTGAASYSGSRDDAIPINNLQVGGTGNDTVTINLFVPSGTLAMGTTTGITFSRDHTGKNLHFSGTRSDVNAALATLTFKPGKTADVQLQVTIDGLPNALYDPSTHHVYQFVDLQVNWNEAKTRAESGTFQDVPGYLTTITSSQEANVVAGLGVGGWLGGSDSAVEGEWNWVGGPDAGTNFWNGGVEGTAPDGAYTNWVEGMPDNYTGSNEAGENCLQMYDVAGAISFKWNDQNCDSGEASRYIIEYGGDTTPSLTYKNINIHVTPGRDLNNDGTEDADQPRVANVQTAQGKWVGIELNYDCDITLAEAIDESSLDAQDANYDYPGGLVDFAAECGYSYMNTQVKLYFYDEQSSDILLRKYNPNTRQYADMTSFIAATSDLTIDGHNVAILTYQITSENGLDVDPNPDDNIIADPLGIAVAASPQSEGQDDQGAGQSSPTTTASGLASTGQSQNQLVVLALMMLGGASIAITRLTAKK